MTAAGTGRVRAAAAVAVIVLALLSRGDALLLAALVVLAAWRLPALVVVPALLASSWRWGSASLEALAGAQAVLGPAGWVGPGSAAAASWLAAIAIVLVVPVGAPPSGIGGTGGPVGATGAPNLWLLKSATPLVGLAAGVTAAAVVAGPGTGGQVWIRVVASVVGTVLVAGVTKARRRFVGIGRVLDGAAVLAAGGALLAASRNAPGWAGTVDAGTLPEGLSIAAASAAVVLVAMSLRVAMRHRRA